MKRSLPTGTCSGSGNHSSTSNPTTNSNNSNNQAYSCQGPPPSNSLMPAAPSSLASSFGTSPAQGGNSGSELLALLLSQQQSQSHSQQNNATFPFSASSSSAPFPQGGVHTTNHPAPNPAASFSLLQQQPQPLQGNPNPNPNSNPDYHHHQQQLSQLQQNSALIAQLTRQLAAGGSDPNGGAVAAMALMSNLGGGIHNPASGNTCSAGSTPAVAMSVGSHSAAHSAGRSASTQPMANLGLRNNNNNNNMARQQQPNQQPQGTGMNGIPSVVQFPSASTAAVPQAQNAHQQAQLQALAAAAASAQQQQQQVQQQAHPQAQARPTTPSTYLRQMHSQLLRNVTSSTQQQQQPTTNTSNNSNSSGSANTNSSRIVPLTNLNTDAPTTTAIGKMNLKKLFVLVRILLAYLEKSDPELHAEAEKIIKECKRKKKAGHIAYGSLSQAIGTRLRLAVGDEHWKMACQIHKRLETGHAHLQRTKGYKKGQKLNVAPAASKDQKSKKEAGDGENANRKKVDDNGNKRVSFGEGV